MTLATRPMAKVEVVAEMCRNLREHLAHPSTNPKKQVRRHDMLKRLESRLQEELHKEKSS